MAKEPTRNGVIFATFVGSMAVFLGSLYWLKSYFDVTVNEEYQRKVLAAPNPELEKLREQETMTLDGYGWVDQQAGVVRIPVERAMELLIEESRAPRPEPAPEPGTR